MIIKDEAFLRLLESAPDAMVIVDSVGIVLLVNSRFEELFDWSRKNIIGESIEILIPEQFRSDHESQRTHFFQVPLARPMGTGLELSALRRDGGQFPVEISLSPMPTEDGVLAIAAIRDITERQHQRDLRQRELRSIEELGSPTTSVTAGTFGFHPIHEYSQSIFDVLCQKYAHLLDLAVEQRIYKVEHNLSEPLRSLAMEIGMLKGGPRDVIKLHSVSLSKNTENTTHEKAQSYLEEGRLLVLELMGHLVSHYRSQIGSGSRK